jgi:hypothetical protein
MIFSQNYGLVTQYHKKRALPNNDFTTLKKTPLKTSKHPGNMGFQVLKKILHFVILSTKVKQEIFLLSEETYNFFYEGSMKMMNE